jgi:AmmeMemoRadiSam system protein B
MIREPAAAGTFYAGSEVALKKQIASLLPAKPAEKSKATAIVLPHAGYIYSAEVALAVIAETEIPKHIILLGPNHTGFGPTISVFPEGIWKTPLGPIPVNENIAGKLLKNCRFAAKDTTAHLYEHCLEVELPLLQYFARDFSIVPIVVGMVKQEEISGLAQAISQTLEQLQLKDDCLLIASTDMTHYEPHKQAMEKDKLAIAAILNLNANELLEIVYKEEISMCGVYPTAVVVESAKQLGAKKARLVKYETSAKASSDFDAVVGYAGLIISNNLS